MGFLDVGWVVGWVFEKKPKPNPQKPTKTQPIPQRIITVAPFIVSFQGQASTIPAPSSHRRQPPSGSWVRVARGWVILSAGAPCGMGGLLPDMRVKEAKSVREVPVKCQKYLATLKVLSFVGKKRFAVMASSMCWSDIPYSHHLVRVDNFMIGYIISKKTLDDATSMRSSRHYLIRPTYDSQVRYYQVEN